jgi:hypothetical protein
VTRIAITGKVLTAAVAVLALWPGGSARSLNSPSLQAAASGGGRVGASSMHDVAELTGTAAGTGTVTFSLYGPDDPTCAGVALQTSTRTVNGDGKYVSDEFVPSAVGTYEYVAAYSGDAENAPASSACGAPGQSVTITSAAPTLVTLASGSVMVGEGIFDTARLVGGDEPSGSLTFSLYGPNDSTCSQAPVEVFNTALTGLEPRYRSPTYTALAEGAYHWIASYGGDARNLPSAEVCGEEGESVLVTGGGPPPIAIALQASPATTVGGEIDATASIAAPNGAAGMLTFLVYGPGDETCQRGALTGLRRQVSGNGQYTSGPYVPADPGVYRFVVIYDGADGRSAATACAAPADIVTVAPLALPVLNRSFTVARVRGTVLVQVHPSTSAASVSSVGFIEVRAPRNVPMGSVVDTCAGTAKLVTATTGSGVQSGVFRGTHFAVEQRASDRGTVELDMRPSAKVRASCGSAGRRARVARLGSLPPKFVARLHAEVKGKFRITTNESSASAHGTSWETTERCNGTLTQVLSDAVVVVDFNLHRTVVVRAGHSHFARSRRGSGCAAGGGG